MTTPITFELAKLLKEKGFEQRTNSYTEDGKLVTVSLTIRRFNPEKIYYPAPTITEVVMWLYEKHNIWISSEPFIKNDNNVVNIYKIFKEGIIDTISRGSMGYDSPTEAYLAAIDYTLNNLI
jgi:tRNA nucleotidyltransferase (CCA-adding enzyme)